MALNKSKHFLEGTLGRDPELRFLNDGSPVCNVSVAVSRWDSKNKEEVTDWHDAVIFGRQAEYIGNHAKKGSEISLEGVLVKETYTDKDGQKRTAVKTKCYEAQLPRHPKQEQPPSSGDYGKESGGTMRGRSQPTNAGRPHNDPSSYDQRAMQNTFDDDIPWE